MRTLEKPKGFCKNRRGLYVPEDRLRFNNVAMLQSGRFPPPAGGGITIFTGAANLTKPSGLINGDAVIIMLDSTAGGAACAGFTNIGSIKVENFAGGYCVVLIKNNVTAASEPATYTITGATVFGKGITKVRGQDTTTFLSGSVTTLYNSSSSTITFPAVTPAHNDTAMFCVAAYWNSQSDYGTPSTFTRIFQDLATGDNASGHAKVLTGGAGASTGTKTATATGATESGAISFCIKPA